MSGTPQQSAPSESEYDRITGATANILARYEWVTRVRTVSDMGTLLSAMLTWGFRVYMLWAIKHEGQAPAIASLFGRKGKADPTPAPATPDRAPVNGIPPEVDLAAIFGITPDPPIE